MIKQFNLVIKDIRTGKNLDIYITILIAITISILGVIKAVGFETIGAATLITLGALSYSLLESRRSKKELRKTSNQLVMELKFLQSIIQKEKCLSADFLSFEYPDLSNSLQQAKKVSILGYSLVTTVTRYYPEFEYLLKQGGSLRFLLPTPDEKIASIMAFRSSSMTNNVDLVLRTVQNSVARIKALIKFSTNSQQIQVREISYLPPFGLVIIEDFNGNAKVYVKIMAFRTPGQLPCFEVNRHTDNIWFSYFTNQFEKLWKISIEI